MWSLADGLVLRSSLVERIGEGQLRALATHWVDYTVDDEKFAAYVFNWSEQGTAVREVLEPHLGPERTDLGPTEDKHIPRTQ